jgi:hypothetical protein
MSLSRLTQQSTYYIFGPTRNILMGASLAYAVEKKENYLYFPIILVFPSVYAGYHIYNNKEAIKEWLWI